jgi:hypothetical protein
LHDEVTLDTLRQILVGGPDADLLDRRILARNAHRGGERIVGLELDHRPHGDTHRGERLFERVKLRPQRRIDAGGRLVAGPQSVSKRLDDVVGCNTQIRLSALDQFQDRLEHADDRAQGPVLPLGEAAQAIEVPEQLVGSVDDVNDHGFRNILRRIAAPS